MQSKVRGGRNPLCGAGPLASGKRNVAQSLYLSPRGSTAFIIDRDHARGKVCPRSRENGNERLPSSKCIIVLLDLFEDEGFLHR
jgi:hypothetical protein